MRLQGCDPGDLVHCDVKGMTFYAKVERPPFQENGRGTCVEVLPLQPERITYRVIQARDVTGLWRKASGSR